MVIILRRQLKYKNQKCYRYNTKLTSIYFKKVKNRMNGPIAEYTPHKGTIAMYPFRNDIWRDNAIHLQEYVCSLVDIISKYETVYFFCESRFIETLRKRYINNSNVIIISASYDDIWARDIGPSFIKIHNQIKCVDWKFNAWGGVKEGSYYPWDKDDAFASFVANYFGFESNRSSIVVEGGGIITDGVGTIFTTRSVLLNRNRNPFKKQAHIEEQLKKSTGATRIIWLKQGLVLDETNGHIDNIMSFVSEKDICLAWTDDRNNPNYSRLRIIEDTLKDLKNLNGERYSIHHVPMPPLQLMTEHESRGLCKANSIDRNSGDVLPASYLNFYMFNNAVLIPSFNCETDNVALECFNRIFSGRKIIPVYSREPLLGGGGIHCLLHEVPTW